MSRFRRLAPYFVLGPLTGPCVAGVVHNLRDGRPVLAGLYMVALLETIFLFPPIVAVLTARTAHQLLNQ
jgi:hypothetical protein